MARSWMKDAREKSGKTQAEVAAALHISESYYCEIENGNRMPRLDLHFADSLSRQAPKIYQTNRPKRRTERAKDERIQNIPGNIGPDPGSDARPAVSYLEKGGRNHGA